MTNVIPVWNLESFWFSNALSMMRKILSLRPNVSQAEAIAHFRSRGPVRWIRDLATGQLRSVAEAYLPFRLYRVGIANRGKNDETLFGLDSVTGTLDLYQFERIPGDEQLIALETRNCPLAQLSDAAAMELLVAKVRRLIYSRGFFRTRDLNITPIPTSLELHIPYWLGFRGSDNSLRLSVIDAVRRRTEGAKVRALFESWLTSSKDGQVV